MSKTRIVPGQGLSGIPIPVLTADHADRSHRGREVAYWLGGLRYIPSTREIVDRWRLSRSAAAKWHAFAETQFRIQQGLNP